MIFDNFLCLANFYNLFTLSLLLWYSSSPFLKLTLPFWDSILLAIYGFSFYRFSFIFCSNPNQFPCFFIYYPWYVTFLVDSFLLLVLILMRLLVSFLFWYLSYLYVSDLIWKYMFSERNDSWSTLDNTYVIPGQVVHFEDGIFIEFIVVAYFVYVHDLLQLFVVIESS